MRRSICLTILVLLSSGILAFQNQIDKTFKLNFNTDYNQFYISDASSPLKTDSKSFWTKEAYADRLASEEGVLGIGTQSRGHIKAEVILMTKNANHASLKNYDHVVEGGLDLKTGNLRILDCPSSAVIFSSKLKPGKYRVRVYTANINQHDIDETEGKDSYRIEIWPDSFVKRIVLKRFKDK